MQKPCHGGFVKIPSFCLIKKGRSCQVGDIQTLEGKNMKKMAIFTASIAAFICSCANSQQPMKQDDVNKEDQNFEDRRKQMMQQQKPQGGCCEAPKVETKTTSETASAPAPTVEAKKAD
jgi:hypothetical protein